MRQKLPNKPEADLEITTEENVFLETNEADLLTRWKREILASIRKQSEPQIPSLIPSIKGKFDGSNCLSGAAIAH